MIYKKKGLLTHLKNCIIKMIELNQNSDRLALFWCSSVYQGFYPTDWGMAEIPIIPDNIGDE